MPDFKEVAKGDGLAIPADVWNALQRVGREHVPGRNPLAVAGDILAAVHPANTVWVRNDTGNDLTEALSVLVPGESVITDEDPGFPHTVRRSPVVAGTTPAATTDAVCVTLEPILKDQIGRAAILGVVPVRITMASESHEFATATAGEDGFLTSAATGTARLLWVGDAPESASDDRWALALLQSWGGATVPEVLADPWSASPAQGLSVLSNTFDFSIADVTVDEIFDVGLVEGNGNAIIKVPANSGAGILHGGMNVAFAASLTNPYGPGTFPAQDGFAGTVWLQLVEVDASGTYVGEPPGSEPAVLLRAVSLAISLDGDAFQVYVGVCDSVGGDPTQWGHGIRLELPIQNHVTDKYYSWRLFYYFGDGGFTGDASILINGVFSSYGDGTCNLFFSPTAVTSSGP